MKKIFLLLFICPFFTNAQFLPNFFEHFKKPESQFYLDTSIYPSSNFSILDYQTNTSGDLILRTQYNFITSNSKLLSRQYTFPNAGQFDYYETTYDYKNDRPFQMRYFRRQKDQPTLEPNGTDSFAYEGQLLKYEFYLSGNQNPDTKMEYLYDSIFGFKGSIMRDLPVDVDYLGMFEAKAFHKANLPSIIYSYIDSELDRRLYRISHFSYDSLDRVVSATDSVFLFNLLQLDGFRKIVYKGNSMKIDSIIETNILYNTVKLVLLEYDEQEKLSQFSRYERKINDEFKLKQRIVYNKNPLGIRDLNKKELLFSLYPNPASDFVFFQSNQKIKQISLYDLQANKLLEQNADDIKMLDISTLSQGVYQICFEFEGRKYFERFIKSN